MGNCTHLCWDHSISCGCTRRVSILLLQGSPTRNSSSCELIANTGYVHSVHSHFS